MGEEKRRYKRLDIRIPARLETLLEPVDTVETTITNLGPEGAFCEVADVLPQGSPVRVSFALEERRSPVSAEGEIRWVTTGEDRRGMGVRFTRITHDDRDAIYRFVAVKLAEIRGRKA